MDGTLWPLPRGQMRAATTLVRMFDATGRPIRLAELAVTLKRKAPTVYDVVRLLEKKELVACAALQKGRFLRPTRKLYTLLGAEAPKARLGAFLPRERKKLGTTKQERRLLLMFELARLERSDAGTTELAKRAGLGVTWAYAIAKKLLERGLLERRRGFRQGYRLTSLGREVLSEEAGA